MSNELPRYLEELFGEDAEHFADTVLSSFTNPLADTRCIFNIDYFLTNPECLTETTCLNPTGLNDENKVRVYRVFEKLAANSRGICKQQKRPTKSRHKILCPFFGCDKKMEGKAKLLRHMTAHTKVRPYPCIYCNEWRSQISNLKRHEKTCYKNPNRQSWNQSQLIVKIRL